MQIILSLDTRLHYIREMCTKSLAKKGRGQRCQVNSHENPERAGKEVMVTYFTALMILLGQKNSIAYAVVC